MKTDNAIALVTGANRGIGVAFTRELLARGGREVYAGARDPSTVTQPGVEAIRLDVTKPEEAQQDFSGFVIKRWRDPAVFKSPAPAVPFD